MKKNTFICLLLLIIIHLLMVRYCNSSNNENNAELVRLHNENMSLKEDITKQEKISDSLEKLVVKTKNNWLKRLTNLEKKLKYKYDAKVSNLSNLDNQTKFRLFSDWLSEIDTIQR